MDFEVKKLEKSQVEIKITVAEERMKEFEKAASAEISENVKIKGFRPGKVPQDILEKHIGKDQIYARAQELAIQKTYAEVVVKEKIQVISRPTVKIDNDSPLKYTATVAVLPEVEVKDYKSIKVKKDEAKVDPKDVDGVLEDVKKRGTTYEEVDRESKSGDRIEIDFAGKDDKGKALEGTESKNHPLILGSKTMIPGFEEALEGLKKGDKKSFDITFPKDYHKKDFQNKKVTFDALVHMVQEPKEPELNEEFIEKLTGKKQSVEDLKKEIEKGLKEQKEQEVKTKQENEYIEELLKKTKVDVPQALIDEEVEFILQDMMQEIAMKGLEFDKFLEKSNTTEEELRKKYVPEAEKRLKIRFALQHVIKEEGINVSDEDIKEELEKIKAQYPKEQHNKIEEDFKKSEVQAQIANRLTLRKLFGKVLA